MKKLLPFLLVGGLFFLVGCTKTSPVTTTTPSTTGDIVTTQNADERQTYQSKTDGFSIQFPGTRSFQENMYGASVVFSSPTSETDKIKENVSIMKKPLPAGKSYTLEEYYTITKEGLLATQTGYTETENTLIKINDLDAKKIVFTSSMNTTKLKFEQVFLIKNNFAYILTYTATEATFDQYAQKVNEMATTLEIN